MKQIVFVFTLLVLLSGCAALEVADILLGDDFIHGGYVVKDVQN